MKQESRRRWAFLSGDSLMCPRNIRTMAGRVFFLVILAVLLSNPSRPALAQQSLVVWERNFDEYDETLPLLKLVLGPQYQFTKSADGLEFKRAFKNVAQNRGVDLISVGTSAALESELHPIRWPTDKGTLGYRVCLIRKGQQPLFDRIRTKEDLKKIRFGLSDHWPDTAIMKNAGYTVVTASRYESLFPMLANGRFDCFLRGIGEIKFEIDKRLDQGFEIESGLLLHYHLTNLLFVRKSDAGLIKDINQGFERIMSNGKFDEFFRSFFATRFVDLHLHKRIVFEVPSDHNSPETEKIWDVPGRMIKPQEFKALKAARPLPAAR